MMKNIFLILTLSTLIFSCKKHKDKIEIYLLKRDIKSSEGMPLLDYLKLKNLESNTDSLTENERNWNYDTIKKQYIYGGEFFVNKEDLQDNPIITDENILKLDLEKSELILSKDGKKAIENLKSARNQFAICINKQPILTGYFRYNFSSTIYSWNYIGYNRQNDKEPKPIDTTFIIRQNPDYQKWEPILTDLSKYPKLVDAFKETGRLQK